jgi:hypothetical protein
MDWLVQNLFSLPPLLDGHREVQKAVASDILTFLRQAAIKIEQQRQLGEEFMASGLIELAIRHNLTIGGIKDLREENAHKTLGKYLAPYFKPGDTLNLDARFQIIRKSTSVKRDDGNGYFDSKVYVFIGTTVDPESSTGPFNCGGPKSDPPNPSPGTKHPSSGGTTVDTTVEPQLNENPASTVVSQPPQHQGVTTEKSPLSQLTQLNTSVFLQRNEFDVSGGENSSGGEKSRTSTVVNCGSADTSSPLVSQPDGKIYVLVHKKSELAAVAETLADVTEPVAIDLKTYNKRYPGPPFGSDEDIRLLCIKAPGFPPWLLDLKEIRYNLGQLGEALQNHEIICHGAEEAAKLLRIKCGLNFRRVWCAGTAQRLLCEEHAKAGSSKTPVWEQYVLLNTPKDPGTCTDKYGYKYKETCWRDDITEEQYLYAAASVEYLHPLKTVLEHTLANSPMRHVFDYLNAKLPVFHGTSYVRPLQSKEETP